MTFQVCSFRVGSLLFGVDVSAVREVLRHQEVNRVPLAPPSVSGLINLRGEIVMAVDVAHRLNIASSAAPLEQENIVLVLQGDVVSLQVDRVGDVLELKAHARHPPPANISPNLQHYLASVAAVDDELLLLLDAQRVADVRDTDSATETVTS